MLNKTLAAALGLALVGAAAPVFADTHVTFVDDKGQVAQQIYVKGGKVRVEGGQGQGIGLYDVAGNSMTVLMPAQKKYLVFNDASATQIGAGADSALQQSQAASAQAQAAMAQHQHEMDQTNKQMEAATANLTPEQKAMIQQQMAAAHAQAGVPTGGIQGSDVVMKDLGTAETVAGHGCKDVQVSVGGRPTGTLCVISSPASLGIPSADLKTLQAMREGMQKLMAQMGMMGKTMGAMMSGGFSLKSTRQSMQGLTPVTETDTYKSLSTSSLSASLFEIPSGYSQTTMQELMQGGHQ